MNRIISATILENDWGVLESNLENLQLVTLHKSPYVAILRAYLSTGFMVGTKWYIIHLLFYHLPSSTDMLFEAHF